MAKFKTTAPTNLAQAESSVDTTQNDAAVDTTASENVQSQTDSVSTVEVLAEVATTPEAPAQDPVTKPADGATEIEDRLSNMLSSGSSLEKVVAQTLQDYAVKMKPGNVLSVDELNQQQLQLWRVIRLVIESGDDFQSCYTFIIDFARAHKDDVFHDRYLYRGMDNISLDKDTATYFMGSLNVIKVAATSKNKREAVAQVDLNRVMNEQVFSEEGRNRVISYFAQ